MESPKKVTLDAVGKWLAFLKSYFAPLPVVRGCGGSVFLRNRGLILRETRRFSSEGLIKFDIVSLS